MGELIKMMKKSTVGLWVDVILTFATGGLWLIVVAIRYMRR